MPLRQTALDPIFYWVTESFFPSLHRIVRDINGWLYIFSFSVKMNIPADLSDLDEALVQIQREMMPKSPKIPFFFYRGNLWIVCCFSAVSWIQRNVYCVKCDLGCILYVHTYLISSKGCQCLKDVSIKVHKYDIKTSKCYYACFFGKLPPQKCIAS